MYKQTPAILPSTLSSPFVSVSVLWDSTNLLSYKDSPTDKGKETLLKLMENKIYVGTNQ